VPRLRRSKAVTCTNALVTGDNRALCGLGWQHLSHHLSMWASGPGIKSVEQSTSKRPGHPATDTYSTPAMSSRSAATCVLSAVRPAAVREIQVVRRPAWMPLRLLT